MENNSKTPLWYGKCGCGWIVTDYPFMACGKCGYIGCGSDEDIEKAKKGGYLINWKNEKPQNVPDSEIEDCCINNPDNYYGEFTDDIDGTENIEDWDDYDDDDDEDEDEEEEF